MKKVLLGIVLLFLSQRGFSQFSHCSHSDTGIHIIDTLNQALLNSINPAENLWFGKTAACAANNGLRHTPKGRLHVLMIFVSYNNYAGQHTAPDWAANDMPDWAKGADNEVFNADPAQIGTKNNISKWYDVMSGGKFKVTGEVVHVNIDVALKSGGAFNFDEMNKRVLNALLVDNPGLDLSKFDRRINGANFNRDNSEDSITDKVIDYIAINYRMAPGGFGNGGKAVIDGILSHNLGTSGYRAWHYGGHYNSGVNSQYHSHRFFHHEFAHNIYDAEHNGGANSTVGLKYYCNQGWGMMSHELPILETVNAWEKWWMGWMNPQTATLNGGNQTFYLKDFITENDALRIPIPGTNHYLWIENHRMLHNLDTKMAYSEYQPSTPGLYAFVTSSLHDCANPNNDGHNGGVNMIKVLSAQGNKDYIYTPADNVPINGLYFPSYTPLADNPISGGNNFTLIRDKYLVDSPNVIYYSVSSEGGSEKTANEQDRMYAKNGVFGAYFVGEPNDVFQVGDELSLSGIVPVLPYPDYRFKDPANNSIITYKLEPILLNGLSVKVMALTNNIYEIQVKYDDTELRADKRWTGDFDLPNLSGNTNSDLTISSHVTLTINKSKIKNVNGKSLALVGAKTNSNPELNWTTPDFILPSTFRCRNGAFIKMSQYSTMVIEEGSQVIIEPSGKIEVQNGAVLHIKGNSTLTLDNQAELNVAYGGKVIVEDGGKIVFNSGGKIHLSDNNSIIEIRNGGKIELGPNAVFNWTGAGMVKVNVTTIGVSNFTAKVPNSNASINISRNASQAGFKSKLIEVVAGGSMSVDKSITSFDMSNCIVEMGQDAILDVDPVMYLNGVKIKANGSGIKHGGIWVYGQQNTPYLNQCVIENASVGFRSFTFKGIGQKAVINNSNFLNCDIGFCGYGKAVEIIGCKFYRNKTGILLDGIQTESLVQQVEGVDNRSAIDMIGSGTEIVRIRNCKLYDNGAVGVFAIKAVAAPGCSEIYNNYSRVVAFPQGGSIFLREESTLMMESDHTPYSGNNDLHTNFGDATGFLYAKDFYFNKSHSNFKSTNGFVARGNLRPAPIRFNTFENQNFWKANGMSPVMNTDYYLELLISPLLLRTISDNQPMQSPPVIGNCIPAGGIGSEPGEPTGDIPAIIAEKASTPIENQLTIEQSFMLGLQAMYAVPNDYTAAITAFSDIIVNPYGHSYTITRPNGDVVSPFLDHIEVIELSYLKMMEAFGMQVKAESGDISVSSDIVLNVINHLHTAYSQYPGTEHLLFNLKLDEVLVHRILKDYSSSLSLLSLLESDQSVVYAPELILYYKCVIENEQFIEENSITKVQYANRGDCLQLLEILERPEHEFLNDLPNDPEVGYGKRSLKDKVAEPAETAALTSSLKTQVYPNPSSESFHVVSEFSLKNIQVFDMSGKLLIEQYITNGLSSLEINHTLANGVYLVKIQLENGNTIKKRMSVVR